ncbi:MAG: hypothetical protein H6Q68_1384 [Firmicutes bacterium]|nr:hypothetical protein [Bacillota bacterium]
MLKKIIVMFAVCLLVAAPAFANGVSQITTVQVTGNSQKEIAPDIAKISLSINTINTNLEQAKNENTQIGNQVFAKLKEQEIPDHQIKTEAYRIDSIYSYENDRLPKLKGYKVINTIEITTSIEKVGILVNELTSVGANEINAIRFEKENETEVKNQALNDAVKDALKKAEFIASALGKRISAVKVVNESGNSYQPVMMESRAYKAANMDAGAPTIVAGKIIVGAAVQVTVELE